MDGETKQEEELELVELMLAIGILASHCNTVRVDTKLNKDGIKIEEGDGAHSIGFLGYHSVKRLSVCLGIKFSQGSVFFLCFLSSSSFSSLCFFLLILSISPTILDKSSCTPYVAELCIA